MLNKNGARELAYVVRIDEIRPIEGADRVELAIVGGWQVMVRKGQFEPADLAIYFEIDSKVPETEPFKFLESKHYKIKTQKYFKGKVLSQGLLMSAEDFGGISYIDGDGRHYLHIDGISYAKGEFLTEKLGVKYAVDEDNIRKANSVDKYKKMAARHPALFKKPFFRWLMRRNWGKKFLFIFFGKKRDSSSATAFPSKFPFITKSDEERVENMPWILNDKTPWVKTTKIDGTSTLFLLVRKPFNKFEYYVCSRNVRQLTPNQKTFFDTENVYWQVNEKFHIKEMLEDLLNKHSNWQYCAVQGETAGTSLNGSKIQGDPHQFGELRFFGYNFIDSEKGRWKTPEAKRLVSSYGVEWVPIIDENYIFPDNFEEFKLSADGECEAPGAHGIREGYVYRNAVDPNRSFKNVSREYLLHH